MLKLSTFVSENIASTHHTSTTSFNLFFLSQLQQPSLVSSQIRVISSTCSLNKNQSGKYKITLKRDRPLTYEMSNPPHYIAHRKAWNSWNTCK